MKTSWLKTARQQKGWTQEEAAGRLGLSQPYLCLLEQGRRPLTKRLLSKLKRHFDVPATELPVEAPRSSVGAQQVAEALGALETRLAEALPWVVLHYPNLNWDWLLERVKVKDLQNRLGFVVALARRLAEQRGDQRTALKLSQVEQQLERARLVREDTLGRESMTVAEQRWLHDKRSPEAQHWNLLTDLVPEHLPYAS
jgi:transcriptional regulator with XRE-family HTH domain